MDLQQQKRYIIALSITLVVGIIFCCFLFTAGVDQNETTTSSTGTTLFKETTLSSETKTTTETTEKGESLCCSNILISKIVIVLL